MNKAMKVVIRMEADGDIEGACAVAKKAGFFVECFDGDGENGMHAPILGFSRKWPDIGMNFYGRNE